jgi:putative membrane protein
MEKMSDPRVFFAAERTLLAWVRSGIAVMALGFVAAKFGLFLSLLSASNPTNNVLHPSNGLSNIFGIALVVIGVVITLGAQLNHHLYVKTLPPEDVPRLAIPWLASLLTVSIGLVGLLLATYLFMA